jgi:hypothetical protein
MQDVVRCTCKSERFLSDYYVAGENLHDTPAYENYVRRAYYMDKPARSLTLKGQAWSLLSLS